MKSMKAIEIDTGKVLEVSRVVGTTMWYEDAEGNLYHAEELKF